MPFDGAPQETIGRLALRAIAAHVLTVPRALFDMDVWQEVRVETPFLFPLYGKPTCKTVGCAIGHSYDLPEVRGTGLRPDHEGTPTFREHKHFDAIAHAFGITTEAARYLFDYREYRDNPTREEVAARIQHTLSNGR